MSEQITIQISGRVMRKAAHMAAQSQRPVEEVLAEWLEQVITQMPVETLSDEEILALADLQLTAEQQEVLSDLLTRNRESALNAEERWRLDELMRLYEQGLLRKAQALRVAVQRGLREPMKAYEFPTRIAADGKFELPETLSKELPIDQEIRVILLVSEPADREEHTSWSRLSAEQFLAGYSEMDAIYDKV